MKDNKVIVKTRVCFDIQVYEALGEVIIKQNDAVVIMEPDNLTPLICALDGFREKEEDDAELFLKACNDYALESGAFEASTVSEILKDFILIRKPQ